MVRGWHWDPVSCLGSKAHHGMSMKRDQKVHEGEDSSTTGSVGRDFETQVHARRKTRQKLMMDQGVMDQGVAAAALMVGP